MSRGRQLGALVLCVAGIAGTLAWLAAARENTPGNVPADAPAKVPLAGTAPKILPAAATEAERAAETPEVDRPVTALNGLAPLADAPPDAPAAAPAVLTFVVVDGQCDPVPGAKVEIWILDRVHRGKDPTKVLTTAADGTCATDLPQEPFHLVAAKDGVGTSGLVDGRPATATPLGDGRTGFVIELHPQGHVTFVVVEAGGQPAAAAELQLRFAEPETGGISPVMPKLAPLDAAGRLQADLDCRGLYQVWAERPGKRTPEAKFLPVPGGRCEVRLEFPGDWWLQGVVVGARDEPIANASVTVWQDAPLMADGQPMPLDVSRTMYTAKADATGRFRIDVARLLPGTLIATSADADGEPARFSRGLEVTPDQARTHEDVVIELPEPASIAGRVRRADGRPVSGMAGAGPAGPSGALDASRKIRITDRYASSSLRGGALREDGSFTLQPVTAGATYDLVAFDEEGGEFAELRGVPAGARDVELVVRAQRSEQATVRGTIVDGATGAPVPWFSMACWRREGAGEWQRAGECSHLVEGERNGFTISGLDPVADHLVRVGAEGYGRTRVFPVRAGAGDEDLTVSLWRTSTLELRVVDADGRAVPWVPVSVGLEGDSPDIDRALALSSARADGAGVARFTGLDAGPVSVTVTRGERTLVRRLELAAGTEHALAIALEREPPR